MASALICQPNRSFATPYWQHFAAHKVTGFAVEASICPIQPIRLNPHIIVGGGDNLARGEFNSGIESSAAPHLGFEQIVQGSRKTFGGSKDNFPSGISGVVIYSDHLPSRGNLQLATQEASGNETLTQRLTRAHEAVERGAKLASQLLAFARRQPLEPVALDVSRLLRSSDDTLRRVLGETIELETVVSGGLWNTLADPNHLQNVIVNLAINARDSMDGAGRLTIEAGNAMLDDDYTRHHDDLSSGQYVMIAVSDTGCGMAPEVLARAFEPFYTTKPEGRGTGLGLSMAYGFMKQTGGHIKLYSEPGHGTTVKLYLPRSMEDEVVRVEAANDPVTGGTETILVVEDDPNVRTTAVAMLTQLGYRVLKAADAQSALSVLESGVRVDLLFSDVVMPGPMRSVDLARRAKEMLPGLEVLFTSGYTENAIVHGGRLDQGIELLSKPYTREALARKIRHVLRNQERRAAGVIASQRT